MGTATCSGSTEGPGNGSLLLARLDGRGGSIQGRGDGEQIRSRRWRGAVHGGADEEEPPPPRHPGWIRGLPVRTHSRRPQRSEKRQKRKSGKGETTNPSRRRGTHATATACKRV
ncbi:hypothetical protein U9M48_030072 [Paspalum notatum var. saurae]|uniref:Uncharacterized protein n=1 Tax=Paspalum notatum var. saurae TaxID=547442 RepID=A0AAQ3U4M6_PASNO